MKDTIVQTVENKIDAAVHAAFMAMGLSVENSLYLADKLNDWLTIHATSYISDDTDNE